MNISITGSRTYPATKAEWDELSPEEQLEQIDRTIRLVEEFVAKLPEEATVVSGGAKGIDSYAVEAAERRGLDTIVFPADWEAYGKGAGFKRNKDIALEAEECLVFWDGESRGTKQFIKKAFDLRRPLFIIGPNGVPWATFDEEFYAKEKEPRLDIPGAS